MADRVLRELAFLPGNGVDHGPVGSTRSGHGGEGEGREVGIATRGGLVAQDHRQIAAADVAGQFGNQQQFFLVLRAAGDLAIEADAHGPWRIARHFAHGAGQRAGEKLGPALGAGRQQRALRQVRHGQAQPFAG